MKFWESITFGFFMLCLSVLVAISVDVNFDGRYGAWILGAGLLQFIWFVSIGPIVKIYTHDPLNDAAQEDSE